MNGCTIDTIHCENCGAVAPQIDDGYTECCNELAVHSARECRNHHADLEDQLAGCNERQATDPIVVRRGSNVSRPSSRRTVVARRAR